VRILGNFWKLKGSANKKHLGNTGRIFMDQSLIIKYLQAIALNYSERVYTYYITEQHFNGKVDVYISSTLNGLNDILIVNSFA
jgi:hypothetical protein